MPISRDRRLFSVCGRMYAPLSPNSWIGARLVRLRESTKLLVVLNRPRSQEVRRGVMLMAVARFRSRSTPTSIPRNSLREASVSRPIEVVSS